jgi:hypothetical protein
LVLPYADADAMNLHLVTVSKLVAPGSHAILELDRAGWHRLGGRLQVPNNISLLHLPPYSPELNPVENIWQYLKQNYLSNRVFETYEDIVDACCEAWNKLMTMPDRIASICTREWARAVTT